MPSEDQILRQKIADAMANIQNAFTDQSSTYKGKTTVKMDMDLNWKVKTFDGRVIHKKGPRKFTQKMIVSLLRDRPDLIEDINLLTNGLRGEMSKGVRNPSGLNISHASKFLTGYLPDGGTYPKPNPNAGRGVHFLLPQAWIDPKRGLLTKLRSALLNKNTVRKILEIPGGETKLSHLIVNLDRLLDTTGSATVQPEGIDPLKAAKEERNYLRQGQQRGAFAPIPSADPTPTRPVELSKKDYVKRLMQRNYFQIQNADRVIAAAPIIINNTAVQGGTNAAVQMGINKGIPVNVFNLTDNLWYEWHGDSEKFIKSQPPSLSHTKRFAGIGSRRLTKQGENAIRELFKGPIPKGLIIDSGGARGADTLFENLGKKAGYEVKAHSFEGHSTTSKNRVIHSATELKKANPFLRRGASLLDFYTPGITQVGDRASSAMIQELMRRGLLEEGRSGKYLTSAEAGLLIDADIEKGISEARSKRVSTKDPVSSLIKTELPSGKVTEIGDIVEGSKKGKPIPFGYGPSKYFGTPGISHQLDKTPTSNKQFEHIKNISRFKSTLPGTKVSPMINLTNWIQQSTQGGVGAINAAEATESFVKAKTFPATSEFFTKIRKPIHLSRAARGLPLIAIPLLLAGFFGTMNEDRELPVS